MPRRKLPGEEKKRPVTVSVDPSIKYEYEMIAVKLGSSFSKEIQKHMIRFIKKHKNDNDKK